MLLFLRFFKIVASWNLLNWKRLPGDATVEDVVVRITSASAPRLPVTCPVLSVPSA
jgi:hypothetical protein